MSNEPLPPPNVIERISAWSMRAPLVARVPAAIVFAAVSLVPTVAVFVAIGIHAVIEHSLAIATGKGFGRIG